MKVKHTERVTKGVLQLEFDVCVAGEVVPSVLWTPDLNTSPRALIAIGHGGSSHKKSENICKRAVRYAKDFLWASLAIDAPKHGDRISFEKAELERAETSARIKGEADAPSLSVEEKIKFLDHLAAQAVPEWQVVLDTLHKSDLILEGTPVAYWGLSQGSSIGIPLLAKDDRFACAVLGLAHLHPDHAKLSLAAQKIAIPLRFVFQWDDTIRSRTYGLALFDAFRSKEKSLHINPGGHTEVPESEVTSWDSFLARHLS